MAKKELDNIEAPVTDEIKDEPEIKKDAKGFDATDVESLIKEATSLGLKIPRLSIGGLKSKKPEDIAKEEARQKKQFIHSLKHAIAKHKANAMMKPIEKRFVLLTNRLREIKARNRAYTYTDVIAKAWLEEWQLIKSNPKAWNKTTENGTKSYTPSSKKKKSALDILDGMDLE